MSSFIMLESCPHVLVTSHSGYCLADQEVRQFYRSDSLLNSLRVC